MKLFVKTCFDMFLYLLFSFSIAYFIFSFIIDTIYYIFIGDNFLPPVIDLTSCVFLILLLLKYDK